MKYNLFGKNLKITKQLGNYAQEKLGKINKFYSKIISLDVELSRDAKHQSGPVYRAEVNLDVPGKKLLRVVEFDYDIKTAIDKATNKIIRQVQKIKGKQDDKVKKAK